jgi:hypothetical protein
VPQTNSMIRSMALVICLGTLSVGASGAPHSTARRLGVDQSAIIQAVLDDARSKWREGEVPCLSDPLESATSSDPTGYRISQSLRDTSPFPLCRRGAKGERHLALHEAIMEGRDAIISLYYVCRLCGHGTDYSLRKIDGSWRVVSRKPSWVS